MRNRATVAGALFLSFLLVACAFGVTLTSDNALLPEGKVAPTRTPTKGVAPLYPYCGFIQIGVGTSNNDGYIDAAEWAHATVYDISDTCGQSDGLPNPEGSCYLYLMHDDVCLYFGIDVPYDLYQDYYDQAGLYFDDNDDGCWPAYPITNEGNIWVVDDLSGVCYLIWRWWQDDYCAGNCINCLDYYGSYTNLGAIYDIPLCCCGISTQAGHVQMEVGIQYGDAATQDYHLQTHLNLCETCGFYIYYLDQYYYDFVGEMPCTGDASTYIWPCSWPSLVCGKNIFCFVMVPFQYNVPIGGTLDFAKHFHNNVCDLMTLYDTLKAIRNEKVVREFTYEWTLACEEDLDLCFALKVPEKDQFVCWDLTICNQGLAVAGGMEYPFEYCFDIHVEPGHGSVVPCP
jgi:hypothetical protein